MQAFEFLGKNVEKIQYAEQMNQIQSHMDALKPLRKTRDYKEYRQKSKALIIELMSQSLPRPSVVSGPGRMAPQTLGLMVVEGPREGRSVHAAANCPRHVDPFPSACLSCLSLNL